MCGRYTLLDTQEEKEIREIVREAAHRLRERGGQNALAHLKTGEVFPTNLVPVVKEDGGSHPMFWGFTLYRVAENKKRGAEGKRPLAPKAVFNTRREKAVASPFWKSSFVRRRCLIPTTGFYEWQHLQKGKKQEYLFALPGGPITWVAGIYHIETHGDTGEKWEHFSMLTTEPSDSVREVHDRMPVVLHEWEFGSWLGGRSDVLDRTGVVLERQTARHTAR